MHFKDIFTGEGMRRGKVEDQAAIKQAAVGSAKIGTGRQSRGGHPTAKQPGRFIQSASGEADDADTTPPGRRGDGGDGFAGFSRTLRPWRRWPLFHHPRSSV